MSSLNEDFGLTTEDAEKTKDIIPTFNLGKLGEGDTEAFKVLEEKPRTVKFKTKDDKGEEVEKEDLVLTAMHRPTGVKQTLWLSSKSLRMQFYKLAKNRPEQNLLGAEIIISVRMYDHPQWGETRGYVVQENSEPEAYGVDSL